MEDWMSIYKPLRLQGWRLTLQDGDGWWTATLTQMSRAISVRCGSATPFRAVREAVRIARDRRTRA